MGETGKMQSARSQKSGTIDPRVSIGHVHLKVSDLERSLAFYCGVLGFELTQRSGTEVAFVSAGGYHHHIGLNTWESLGGSPPPAGTTGLFHFAVRYPDRAALGDALQRLMEANVPLDGANDHGVSEAIYLRDPDQNGIELYRDRPRDEWPRNAMAQSPCLPARSISTLSCARRRRHVSGWRPGWRRRCHRERLPRSKIDFHQ